MSPGLPYSRALGSQVTERVTYFIKINGSTQGSLGGRGNERTKKYVHIKANPVSSIQK